MVANVAELVEAGNLPPAHRCRRIQVMQTTVEG